LQAQLASLGYSVGTPTTLLSTNLKVKDLLTATAAALTAQGNTTAAAAVNNISDRFNLHRAHHAARKVDLAGIADAYERPFDLDQRISAGDRLRQSSRTGQFRECSGHQRDRSLLSNLTVG